MGERRMRARARMTCRLRRRRYPNVRTIPKGPFHGDVTGRWTRGSAGFTLVLALVASMLAPAVSQASGRSRQVVARPPRAQSAARALATATTPTSTPRATTTVPALAPDVTTAVLTASATTTVTPTATLTPAATNTVTPTATATVTPTAIGCPTPYLHTF